MSYKLKYKFIFRIRSFKSTETSHLFNTPLGKLMNKRVVSHVQKLYQSELNKLTAYMKENGFELSQKKMCLMLFNNGENQKSLPQIELDGQLLNYQQNTKLGGCI